MIIDANALLPAYFPDENQGLSQALLRDHVTGRRRLKAPDLLQYEVANAIVQATRRGRISDRQGRQAMESFEGLGIELAPVDWPRMLDFANRFDRSAYDAAYLALADSRGEFFITGDLRMCNSVKEHLDWVVWLGDFDDRSLGQVGTI
ncbi:MAG: type II toxin-antitoxin system VapC family toxin [Chloroflexi bacterium]|nr:type II toxin-antitoxin system VapC family toxin [Chloroflexota bacterium]